MDLPDDQQGYETVEEAVVGLKKQQRDRGFVVTVRGSTELKIDLSRQKSFQC